MPLKRFEMSISTIALSGFHRAEVQLQASASNITRALLPDAKAVEVQGDNLVQGQDQIDLSSEMVAMKSAQTLQSAVARVVEADKDTTKALLNMTG
jgi:predicted transcriptional regulator